MVLRGDKSSLAFNKCLLMAADKGLVVEMDEHRGGAVDFMSTVQPILDDGKVSARGGASILAYLDTRGQGGSLNPKKAAILGKQNFWVDVAGRFADPVINSLSIAATVDVDKRQDLSRALDALERQLAAGDSYIVGEYSIADVHWTAIAHFCECLNLSEEIASRPAGSAWFERIKGRKNSVDGKLTFECLQGPISGQAAASGSVA